jgi:hypothetical protein
MQLPKKHRFLTCGNNLRALSAMLLVLCMTVFGQQPTFTFTHEITSNDIYGLAGHEDTLWMTTSWGVNYTIAKSESLSWYGYKSDPGRFLGPVAFGDASVLAALASEPATSNPSVAFNRLFMFSHKIDMAGTFKTLSPGFSDDGHLDKITKSADFSVNDIAWSKGFYWLACLDGGLVRIAIGNESMTAFLPGNSKGFAPSKMSETMGTDISKFPDTLRRVIAVDVVDPSGASPLILVASRDKMWKFSPLDSSWNSFSNSFIDPHVTFDYYQNVYSSGPKDSYDLYAAIRVKKNDVNIDTTCFFKYDTSAGAWRTLLENFQFAPSVTFGLNHEIYCNGNNQVFLYKDSAAGLIPIWGGDIFQKRMTRASNGNYPNSINDMLCLPYPDGRIAMWIGSSTTSLPVYNGLFFSLNEKKDESDTAAFGYVHRDNKLVSGLKQSYAFPGILHLVNGEKTVFAYNLSKSSNVTIKIYDWNMDPVKTVVHDRPREAGNDNGNGRSTKAGEDTWDGTTDSGRRVAAGVYYYKITAKSGEHAFGKIIIAK